MGNNMGESHSRTVVPEKPEQISTNCMSPFIQRSKTGKLMFQPISKVGEETGSLWALEMRRNRASLNTWAMDLSLALD